MLVAGLILICLGLFSKIGAVLSTIPTPLVGGVLASSMAMVFSCLFFIKSYFKTKIKKVGGVAIANVQSIDLNNSRNVGILGFALMIGMIVPTYAERHLDIVFTGKKKSQNRTINHYYFIKASTLSIKSFAFSCRFRCSSALLPHVFSTIRFPERHANNAAFDRVARNTTWARRDATFTHFPPRLCAF